MWSTQVPFKGGQKHAYITFHETTVTLFRTCGLVSLNHVCGEHEWADGECTHGPLVSTENGKAFLEMDSKPHKAVRDIVADRTWLKTLAFYVKFRYVKSEVIRHL